MIIVALNFLYNDFKPFELRLLGRRPNALQARFHARLLALLATCDSPADVPIPAGRSGPEFIARLVELEQFVMASPAGTFDNYEDGFGDCSKHDGVVGWVERNKVDAPSSPSPAAPYHSLDASRLKLTGRGNWPLGDFLHDELWLPYFEPRILHHGLPLDGVEIPDFSVEDKKENLKLAKLWSSKGLLALFDEEPPGPYYTRVFNNYKSTVHDRMIGDRRQPNAAERAVAGPSRQLPMMTSMLCPRGFQLVGSVTDRKDFYHQALISRQKAHLNCLPFAFPISEFKGTDEEQCESDTPNLALHIVSKPMPKTLMKKPGMKMKKPAASLALKEPEVAEPAAPAASVSDEVPLHCISKTRASEPERTYIQACQCHFPHAKAKEHKKQLIVQYSLAQDGPDHFDKAVKAMKYIEDHCLTWSQARNIKTLFPQ